jgi:hypothetical protein
MWCYPRPNDLKNLTLKPNYDGSLQRPNASRFSRAHETSNNKQPQSAKDYFTKNRARGVGCKRLLGGNAGLKPLPNAKPTSP